MTNQFQVLDIHRTYYWVSNNALVEVRFSKAIISTYDGAVVYFAILPDGKEVTINSTADEPIKVYGSPKDYINNSPVHIHPTKLEKIARNMNLQIRYKEMNGEKVSFYFVVWTIDNGIAKEHRLYGDKITVFPNPPYTTNSYALEETFPENYYNDREIMEKLHPTKVIAKDGTESVVGGELSGLLLSDEQKVILDEWLKVTKKLEEANVLIISSEGTCKHLALNKSQIESLYGYQESYEGIISLDAARATEFHIPQLPLNVCSDYDSGEMWFIMKK